MNKKIILIVTLALIAGLTGGFLGEMINRNYFAEDIYKYPLLMDSTFPDAGIDKSDFMIKGAEKLIVEQNEQINTSIRSVKKNLVGIFPYKELNANDIENEEFSTSALMSTIDAGRFYHPNQRIGEGVIITSDGWIMANIHDNKGSEKIKKDHRVITSQNEVFEIDKTIKDEEDDILFLHLKKAKDLPAIELAGKEEIGVGNLVFATNGDQKALVTNIVEKEREKGLVRSSDQVNIGLKLTHDLNDFFDTSPFVFNLDKQAVGVQTTSERIVSMEQLKSDVQSLLEFDDIKKGELGAHYVDLANVKMAEKYPRRGALIYPDSEGVAVKPNTPADKAGLKEGDIILSINNQKIDKDHDLAHIIQSYLPGDELNIHYARGNKEHRVEVVLE